MIESASTTSKLFVGIKVPLTLAHSLANFSQVQRIDDDGIRWLEPDDLHITLKFIGAVPSVTNTRIIGELRNIRSPHFTLCLDRAEVFQDAEVLIVGIQKTRDLLSLQAAIAKSLCLILGKEDERAYRAHITLARWSGITTNRQGDHNSMRIMLDAYCRSLSVRSFVVEKIILYETVAKHYQVVEEFKLDG